MTHDKYPRNGEYDKVMEPAICFIRIIGMNIGTERCLESNR